MTAAESERRLSSAPRRPFKSSYSTKSGTPGSSKSVNPFFCMARAASAETNWPSPSQNTGMGGALDLAAAAPLIRAAASVWGEEVPPAGGAEVIPAGRAEVIAAGGAEVI